MIPLCQINCDELPMRPEPLVSIRFLTVFVVADRLPPNNAPNGEGWLLRTYQAGQPLKFLEQPATFRSPVKAFPIRWESIEHDYPCWEDAVASISDPALRDVFEENQDRFPNHFVSKVGGWPSLIQGGLFTSLASKPKYVFQVDSESKAHWGWGDGGFGYFGYALEQGQPQWFLDWQQL